MVENRILESRRREKGTAPKTTCYPPRCDDEDHGDDGRHVEAGRHVSGLVHHHHKRTQEAEKGESLLIGPKKL